VIGLLALPDGAWTVTHPRGPMWLLIRRRRIVAAQLWDKATETLEMFPPPWRVPAAVPVDLAAYTIAEGVTLAG
jgi:hypothetical protein